MTIPEVENASVLPTHNPEVGHALDPRLIRSFRLAPEAFEGLVKRRHTQRLRWLVPFALLLLVSGPRVMSAIRPNSEDPFNDPLFHGFFALVILGTLVAGAVLGRRRQLKEGRPTWDSYLLTISPNVLRRVMMTLPPVEIIRTEVTKIVNVDGRGTTVMAGRSRFIFIPKELIGFDEVRQQLATWRSFEPRGSVLKTRVLQTGWWILLSGLWLASWALPNFGYAMVAGVLLFAMVVYSIREVLSATPLANRHKVVQIWSLGSLLAVPLLRLIVHFHFHVW